MTFNSCSQRSIEAIDVGAGIAVGLAQSHGAAATFVFDGLEPG